MSGATSAGDAACVSVRVEVSPEDAFAVFTEEIDAWWKRGPEFRVAGKRRGVLAFEPGVEGRLFETFETASGSRTHEVGRITAWQPPSLLAFEWRGVNFKPHELTRVEVRFEKAGEGTLVTVRHSGWSVLPSDHPVRHGLVGAEFSRMMGLHWGKLLTGLREYVDDARSPP